MAKLIPADKGTHFVLGALCALVLVLLFTPAVAALGALAVAIGREVYGFRARGGLMSRYDAIESLEDVAATLAGAGVVLAATLVPIWWGSNLAARLALLL